MTAAGTTDAPGQAVRDRLDEAATPSGAPSGPIAVTRRRRPGEQLVTFGLSLAGYLGVAWWMVVHDVIFPDSVSRVANAYYVLFSRDPHLPAVGFVWNPLPSLLLLPVLPLRHLFPVLTRDGFAGPIESSIFMAGAVVLLLRLLRSLGVSRRLGWLLTALFAASPMIVIYGASGESEGMLLFFALLASGQLTRWLRDREPVHLVGVGLALGAAYLTRYEAVAPAAAVVLLVAVVSYVRTVGPRPFRALTGLNDALLAGLPFVFTFAVWSLSSRILVNQWFPTFSSSVGNSSQVAEARSFITRGTGSSTVARLDYSVDQIVGLQPLIVVLVVVAAAVAIGRRNLAALGAPTVLGSILLFDNLAFLSGTSFGWLRFQITVIPLAFALAATALATRPASATRTQLPVTGHLPRRLRWAPPRLAPWLTLWLTPWLGHARRLTVRATSRRWPRQWRVLAVVAILAVSLPVSVDTLASHRLAREETDTMLAAVDPGRANPADRLHLNVFQTEHRVADSIDAMHLPPGSVVTDSTYAYDVILSTRDPHQFVITSDRDFSSVLNFPLSHHARYLLVPDPAQAPFDAIDKRYPGLYADGGHIATEVRLWKGTSYTPSWKLYRTYREQPVTR